MAIQMMTSSDIDECFGELARLSFQSSLQPISTHVLQDLYDITILQKKGEKKRRLSNKLSI